MSLACEILPEGKSPTGASAGTTFGQSNATLNGKHRVDPSRYTAKSELFHAGREGYRRTLLLKQAIRCCSVHCRFTLARQLHTLRKRS